MMLDEGFRCPDGSYNEKNAFWSAWGLRDLITGTTATQQAAFSRRIDGLKTAYAEISAIYQKNKAKGTGADVPIT